MSDHQPSLDLLKRLIAFPSVSRCSNAEISDWIADYLRGLQFDVERTNYTDRYGVQKVNVVARRDPVSAKATASEKAVPQAGDTPRVGLAYFCHTDVVPADHWSGPGGDPFAAVVSDDRVYGRGACDMKGSLAAMLVAAESFPVERQTAPLWIVCTADEEVGFEGAKHLVEQSPAYRELVRAQPACIIGEPTRLSVVHAHKGIQAVRVTSRGRAAHSSSNLGINANVAMVPMLQTLLEIEQQTRSDARYHDARFDPPTLTWTFGVSDGCRAVNVTPSQTVAWVSLRTMPEIDGEDLIDRVRERAKDLGLDFERLPGGGPLWLERDSAFVREMAELTETDPHTVAHCTDGGQFQDLQRRVVWGPGDIAQAHTSDEWLSLEQLQAGIELNRRAISRWCS